jgi:hypothetical protein
MTIDIDQYNRPDAVLDLPAGAAEATKNYFKRAHDARDALARVRRTPLGLAMKQQMARAEESKKRVLSLWGNTDEAGLDARFVEREGLLGIFAFPHVPASVMAREMRRAWQYVTQPCAEPPAQSVEEAVLADRFLRADARAAQMNVAFSLIAEGVTENERYGQELIATLEKTDLEACRHSLPRLCAIASDPVAMKIAMRRVFDDAIAAAPAQRAAEEQLIETIDATLKGKATERRWLDRLLRRRPLRQRGVRAAFVTALVARLGVMEASNGNYLTETPGLPFNASFYTRICNVRLETLQR